MNEFPVKMLKRKFGKNGFEVSALGFGAGHIGGNEISDNEAGKLLNYALDNGINLFDTARGYGLSEERIGKFLSYRRNEIILSTKVGYDIPGYGNWTYEIILAGIDAALKKLRTDYIDIVHLHSCSKDILLKGEVIDALEKAKSDGKIKIAAYSGENESLDYAVHLGRFSSIQTSVNVADQRALCDLIPKAKENGMGVIAKRPVANALWKYNERPAGNYAEEYWSRWQIMKLYFDIDPQELFIRFSAFAPGVDSAIIGTSRIEHLKSAVSAVNKGVLPEDIFRNIRNSFSENDDNWIGKT
jgi:aryl-alcohol dehydrogenase-like predicted oxidoreductase